MMTIINSCSVNPFNPLLIFLGSNRTILLLVKLGNYPLSARWGCARPWNAGADHSKERWQQGGKGLRILFAIASNQPPSCPTATRREMTRALQEAKCPSSQNFCPSNNVPVPQQTKIRNAKVSIANSQEVGKVSEWPRDSASWFPG